MKQTKNSFIRLFALCLVISLIAPVAANGAAIEPALPMASQYIDDGNATISAVGFGRVEIVFEAVGTDIMDKIGVRSIEIYESPDNVNWTYVRTISCDTYLSMIAENAIRCRSSVFHQGVPGRYYKAYLCFWAEKNGRDETQYKWTSEKRAT